MHFSTNFLRKLERIDPELREILYSLIDEIEKNREASVDKKDFSELKELTANMLAAVGRLAEAQEKTEKQLEKLAEAQEKTEEQLKQLSEAQRKTEERLDKLAEAQLKTEEVVRKLVVDLDDVKKQVGGLSMAVGYGIEDKLIPLMPTFIKNEFGFKVITSERENIFYPDGSYDEVNILSECRKGNKKVYVVGECKSQPGKKDVERFAKQLARLKKHFKTEVRGFLVGYIFSPETEKLLKEKYSEIKYYKTYQVERIAAKS